MRHSRLRSSLGFSLYLVCAVAVILGSIEALLRIADYHPDSYMVPRFYTDLPGDLEPNQRMREVFYEKVPYLFSTNSQGFRGIREISRTKSDSTIRILCLGDSFTFGFGVDDRDAYPELLRKELELRYPGIHFEVINAGMPLFGILDEMDYYLQKGCALRPDLVILQFFTNDLQDLTRIPSFREAARMEPARSTRSPLSRLLSWSRLFQVLSSLRNKLSKTAFYASFGKPSENAVQNDQLAPYRFKATDKQLELLRESKFYDPESRQALAPVWDGYRRALDAFAGILARDGVPTLFVGVEDNKDVVEFQDWCALNLYPHLRELRIPAINMTPLLQDAIYQQGVNPYLLPRDGHLSPIGNRLLARAVADRITTGRKGDGKPVLSLLETPAPDPVTARMVVDLMPDEQAGLRAFSGDKSVKSGVVARDNLVFEQFPSPEMLLLKPGPEQGRAGSLVLRVDSGKGLSMADFWFSFKFDDKKPGSSAIDVSVSLDGTHWERRFHKASDGTARDADFESYHRITLPFQTQRPKCLFIRIDLTGKAAIFSEPKLPHSSYRKLELRLGTDE